MTEFVPADFEKLSKGIIEDYKKRQAKLGVEYVPNENDVQHVITEACAYRQTLQAAAYNYAFSQMYLDTAEGKNLDRLAKNVYGIERLKGSKPTAKAKFELTAPRSIKTVFPVGYTVASDEGVRAVLIEESKIEAGATESSGMLELQLFTVSSDIKTEVLINPLPYLKSVSVGKFEKGDDPEGDEKLRNRCKESMYLKSTAGSVESYEYHTRTADPRIEQVSVVSPKPCETDIYYWAQIMDTVMWNKVHKALSDDKTRPLSDLVTIREAKEIEYSIKAVVTLPENIDRAAYEKTILGTREKIKKLSRIGVSISVFQIANILAVFEDVIDVSISEPAQGVKIGIGEIPILKDFEIGFIRKI